MTDALRQCQRLALRAIGALALAAATSCREGVARPERPSIVIFDVDTLRADGLGLYGNTRPTSPNLDEWARTAVVFDWAFSQAPTTPPSQASILSGLYPSSHGRIGKAQMLRSEATTLAEALRAGGYRTAAFVDGGFMSPGFGLEQGFDLYDDSGGKGLEAIAPKAIRWLLAHGEQPYFLLVHTYDVHTPYTPLAEHLNLVAPGTRPSTPGFEPTAELLERVRIARSKGADSRFDEGDIRYTRALYDGEIRQMDSWFGRFHRGLAEGGFLERTILVFLSDHGEEFQEHGSVLHEKLYSTVTHIPLVISMPGRATGSRRGDIVQSIDLAPTLLRLAGLPVPTSYEGQDLLLPQSRRSFAYGESPFFGRERYLALGDWRLLYRHRKRVTELYRYREDPLEQRDLTAVEPEQAANLRRALARIEAKLGERRVEPVAGAEPDEALRKQLDALGYLH